MKKNVKALKEFLKNRNLELATTIRDGKVLIVLHDHGSGEWAESVNFEPGVKSKYYTPENS
jgi:hypothetical protein